MLAHILEVALAGDRMGALAAEIEARPDLIAEQRRVAARPVVDHPGDALGLVRREGVHRIENDRLNSGLTAVAITMIEQREQETLGLAGSRAGCYEGRARVLAVALQPLPGAQLVGVGVERRFDE